MRKEKDANTTQSKGESRKTELKSTAHWKATLRPGLTSRLSDVISAGMLVTIQGKGNTGGMADDLDPFTASTLRNWSN